MKSFSSATLLTAAAAVLCALLTGCSESSASAPALTTAQEPTAAVTQTEPAETQPETTAAAEAEMRGLYKFNPKAYSVYMEEIFGETMCQTWCSFVDAMLAGEDTFACPDQETFEWVLGQFPHLCLPAVQDLVDYPTDRENAVADGIAHFTYTVPRDEFEQALRKLADKTESILNEVLADADTDFEKALALYLYFADNYVYDHDLEHNNTDANKLTALHVLYEKRGICQEISQAYSFLLTQAGVEATVMSGIRAYDQAPHRWSYIRLNGRNYHIDPTYVLGTHDLSFFLMTDEERAAEDDYPIQDHVITSAYTQVHDHPVYKADDETFSALWMKTYASIDTENKLLTYYTTDENFIVQYDTFSYDGY